MNGTHQKKHLLRGGVKKGKWRLICDFLHRRASFKTVELVEDAWRAVSDTSGFMRWMLLAAVREGREMGCGPVRRG